MYKMYMNIAGPFFLLGSIGIRKVKEGHNISTLPALPPSGGRHENFWGITCEKS
jgi:hypothetical protein